MAVGQPILDLLVGGQPVQPSGAFTQEAALDRRGGAARLRRVAFRPKMVRQLPAADRGPFHGRSPVSVRRRTAGRVSARLITATADNGGRHRREMVDDHVNSRACNYFVGGFFFFARHTGLPLSCVACRSTCYFTPSRRSTQNTRRECLALTSVSVDYNIVITGIIYLERGCCCGENRVKLLQYCARNAEKYAGNVNDLHKSYVMYIYSFI